MAEVIWRRPHRVLWYEFVTDVEVATLSELPPINEAVSRRRHSLVGHVRRMDQTSPVNQASQSRHDRAQDSLTAGGDNQVAHENDGRSKSP